MSSRYPFVNHGTEAVAWRCYIKMVFLNISQNSEENICVRDSFLTNIQAEERKANKWDSGTGVLLWIYCDTLVCLEIIVEKGI